MITIYGSDDCIWCLKAKQLAEVFKLEHEYKSIGLCMEEFTSKFPSATVVPVIVWDGHYMSGYEEFANAVNLYLKMEK